MVDHPSISRRLALANVGAVAGAAVVAAVPMPADAAAEPEFDVPGITDQNAYALEITGNSLHPVYRVGDTIIVSPAAAVRKGDRVLMRMASGRVCVVTYEGETERDYLYRMFHLPGVPAFALKSEVDWVVRIVWASQ